MSVGLFLSIPDGTSNCPGPTWRENLYPIIILPNRLWLGKVMFSLKWLHNCWGFCVCARTHACVLRTLCSCYSLVQTIITVHRVTTVFDYIHWWCVFLLLLLFTCNMLLWALNSWLEEREMILLSNSCQLRRISKVCWGWGDEFFSVRSLQLCSSGLCSNGLY